MVDCKSRQAPRIRRGDRHAAGFETWWWACCMHARHALPLSLSLGSCSLGLLTSPPFSGLWLVQACSCIDARGGHPYRTACQAGRAHTGMRALLVCPVADAHVQLASNGTTFSAQGARETPEAGSQPIELEGSDDLGQGSLRVRSRRKGDRSVTVARSLAFDVLPCLSCLSCRHLAAFELLRPWPLLGCPPSRNPPEFCHGPARALLGWIDQRGAHTLCAPRSPNPSLATA